MWNTTKEENCVNSTYVNYVVGGARFFYIDLFIFVGMLISVIFIPTHLFLLYVTNSLENVKGKNFMSLMLMLLMKYLFILLNTIVRSTYYMKLLNVIVLSLVYTQFSATCWLCIIAAHSLNIVKKRLWRSSYNVRWISMGMSSVLGWILPGFFLLFSYIFTVLVGENVCQSNCADLNRCQGTIFYIVFQTVRLSLLIRSAADIVRVRYYTSYIMPQENALENITGDLDYINFSFMFCIIFYVSWLLETVGYIFQNNDIAFLITSVASSAEAISVILATLWGRKCFPSVNAS